MSWKLLDDPDQEQSAELFRQFGKKAKFLLDENLEGDATQILRRLGWNAKGVSEFRLKGHEDEDIFGLAWREDRMLLTNDRDFLNEARFPEQRNPGVIVLPAVPKQSNAFIRAMHVVVHIFGPLRDAYRKCKIEISEDGIISITRRNIQTGRMEKSRYHLGRDKATYEWVE